MCPCVERWSPQDIQQILLCPEMTDTIGEVTRVLDIWGLVAGVRVKDECVHRDTSPISKRLLLGPFCRIMPRALWWP